MVQKFNSVAGASAVAEPVLVCINGHKLSAYVDVDMPVVLSLVPQSVTVVGESHLLKKILCYRNPLQFIGSAFPQIPFVPFKVKVDTVLCDCPHEHRVLGAFSVIHPVSYSQITRCYHLSAPNTYQDTTKPF